MISSARRLINIGHARNMPMNFIVDHYQLGYDASAVTIRNDSINGQNQPVISSAVRRRRDTYLYFFFTFDRDVFCNCQRAVCVDGDSALL